MSILIHNQYTNYSSRRVISVRSTDNNLQGRNYNPQYKSKKNPKQHKEHYRENSLVGTMLDIVV